MKAYYENGHIRFTEPKRRKIKFLIAAVVVILITLTAFSSGKSDFRHSCGIEIPGIENQKFCIGYDNGVYYDNDKLRVYIK